MLERIFRRFRRKEAEKKYIPAVGDLHELISAKIDEFHDSILFWTGSKNNPEAKFTAKIHGKSVNVVMDSDSEEGVNIFEIGVGDDKGLFFRNRTLLPGYEVFKLKRYTEIHNRDGIAETIDSFIKKAPKPDEINDIRLETFKQRMILNQNTVENKISISVGRAPRQSKTKK
jgi:hypothetical protein